eukprot:TRINITY_DN28031_c0_g1_i1.p1 TRINITY_DN28031_c0_g1~~TRINITY_DN28031_c0_g1_i1.p1  ORF type:complete len:314 (-),score=33.04 TRINITY_DN28031_c0_g1_i1:120-947(-)
MSTQLYSELNVTKDNAIVEFGKLIIANRMNAQLKRQKMAGTSEAIYNPKVLAMYDAAVWRFNSPALWRISKNEIHDLYRDCVGADHCEIAVGTGLFLKDYVMENESPQQLSFSLFDLNKNTIDIAEKRINEAVANNGRSVHFKNTILDITKPESISEDMKHSYDSVAANYLLHCLHGNGLLDKDKFAAIQSCASLVKEDGCFFGSTLLGKDMLDDADNAGPAAIKTIKFYNKIGIFGNMNDCMADLESVLNELFGDVELWRTGYCAVWKAKAPKV